MITLSNKMANNYNNNDYHNTAGPKKSFRQTARLFSGEPLAQAQMPQVAVCVAQQQKQQHERLVVPSSSGADFFGHTLRNTHHHDHHHYQKPKLTMKFNHSTNNGRSQQKPQTNARKLIVPFQRPQPSKWFNHGTQRELTAAKWLPLLLVATLVQLAYCPSAMGSADLQQGTITSGQPAVGGEPTAIVAPTAAADSAPKPTPTTNDQQAASAMAAAAVAPSSGAVPESDSKAKGETLMASESKEEKYSPPVDAQGDSSGAAQKQSESRAEQQLVQVEETAVPAVSGLTGQEELQNSNETPVAQQTTTMATLQQQQQLIESDQQSEISTLPTQQQTADGSGSATGSNDSAARAGGGAENDVLPMSDPFNRKSSNEPSGEFAQSHNKQTTNQSAGSKGKIRSLKRAFGGHMGVFGRKRTSNHQEQAGGEEFPLHQQQQIAMGFEQPATVKVAPTYSPRHYYYKQSIEPGAATSVRPHTSSTRTKLKEADFPDYHEILIQPDGADLLKQQPYQQLQQQQQQQQHQHQQQPIFEAQNHELTRTTGQQQVDVAADLQPVEQGQIQINENEFSEQPEVKQQQQQQLEMSTISQQQQQESLTNQTGGISEQLGGGGTKSSQQLESNGAPFIRLSNIATINSSSSDSTGGNSTNGVKLMRIYVIDLDQKLVVGGGGESNNSHHGLKGVQFPLPDSRSSSQVETAGTSPATPLPQFSGQQQLEQYQLRQEQLSQQHEEQQHHQPATVPEGYVLLDRDSLQANLSQMFSKLGSQYEQSAGPSVATMLSVANYSHGPAMARAHHSEPLNLQRQQFQYQAADTPPGPLWFSGPQPTGYNNGSAQMSGDFSQYNHHHQQPPGGYGSRGSNYTQAGSGYRLTQGVHPVPADHIVANYPEPVGQQQVQQYQQQPTQVHQSIPQYIAPQYNRPASGFSHAGPNNPDNEQQQPYSNEWSPAQQQPVAHHHHQPVNAPELNPSSPSPYSGSSASSFAPGPMEQVRYNNNNNNNYTSKPTLFVQAPTSRQQDKHHANGSHLNVYHQGQQQPSGLMYQQQQQQVVLLDPTPVYSTQAQSALAAVSAYGSSLRGEPAQSSSSSYSTHNNEPNGAAHKVTTAPISDQSWKPVDYSAPAAYSQTQQQPHYLQHQQSSINPAQYTNSNRPSINGDHDVVSLAAAAAARGNGQRPAQAAHQRQVEPSPGQFELENPAINSNQSQSQAYDGQHAPVNYQSRKSYPNKQVAYVNTQTDEQQPSRGQHLMVPDTQSSYPSPAIASAVAPVYSSSANDAPSQQVLPTSGGHPSFAPAQSAAAYQYNGTAPQSGSRGDGGHAWSAASGDAQPANDYQSSRQQQQQQQYGVTNEYPSPKGLSKQHSSGYAQMDSNNEHEQYGTNPLAAYGNQGQLTGAKQQPIKLATDQSLNHKASRIPQEATNSYWQNSYKQQAAPSAYLAVNGPPVADGVYSSEEPAAPPTVKHPNNKPPRYRGAKQASNGRGKAAKRPAANGSAYNNNKANTLPESNYAHQQLEQQQEPVYQQEQVNSEQAGQLAAEEYQTGPSALYGAPYNRPHNNYGPQQQYQRPPMVAVANYYRAPPGAKGLLSLETLQSVASGAAKRLPSLSSILMPFSSGPSKGGLYPTANYPQHHQARYPKSAHFDRDVAGFHRPYPLRHMPLHPSGYRDQADLGSKHETEPQQQHQQATADMSQEADHQAAEYGPDLSSSSSASSDSGQILPSASASAAGSAGPPEEVFSAENPEENQSGEYRPVQNGGRQPLGNLTILSMHDEEEGAANKQNTGDTIEFAPDETPVPPGSVGKPTRARGARPKGGNQDTRPPKAVKLESGSTKLGVEPDQQQLDPVQAAALSSIEQQLSSQSNLPKRKQPKRSNKIPTLSSASSSAAVAAAAAAAAASTDFLEPTILSEHNAPVPLESLPADQQRLLMGTSGGAKHLRGTYGSPSNIVFPPTDEQSLSGTERRPMGSGGRPLPLNSMQIGQFKITPQMQFVQSIIEPSRQMFGQYFKQYIGQLGQTLG